MAQKESASIKSNTGIFDIGNLTAQQRAFFETGKTLPAAFRIEALSKLRASVIRHEKELCTALQRDLNKAPQEAYMTEIGMVCEEITYLIKHLKKWMRPQKVRTPMAQFKSKSYLFREPYGVTLIMSPWNYPLQLCLIPLAGAMAGGNCAVVKPSAYAPCTARVINAILRECFSGHYVSAVLGGREENNALLKQKFDYIFFTGSKTVGRLVMEAAAKSLTPVTLELGGKSPCIIDKSANIPLTAKRILFGKILNAGQTCVAPDYILVHNSVRQPLIQALREQISVFLGPRPEENPDYPKIINEKHFDRLLSLLKDTDILSGGGFCRDTLKIAPTLVADPPEQSPLMQDEIFGPILPVISYQTTEDAMAYIRRKPRPLSLYLFCENKTLQQKITRTLSFGGGCINDTIVHLASSRLPFGGVGESGMGAYHGRYSFETFTHTKSILDKSTGMDLSMRYHPYTAGKQRLIRKFLG